MLDERAKRLWAATEAESLGHGGIACVARATGMSRRRIHAGLRELREAGPGGVESAWMPPFPTEYGQMARWTSKPDAMWIDLVASEGFLVG